MLRALPHAAALAAVCLSCPTLLAQRGKPVFEWQSRSTVIDYGVVPARNHPLDELTPGTTWRLGMNDATTWRLELPLVAGDTVLPPGSYRVGLLREDQQHFALVLAGSGAALGGGQPELRVAGELAQKSPAADKLAIDWRVPTKADKGQPNQAIELAIAFGDHQWTGKLLALGGKPAGKVGGYQLEVFSVPPELLAARDKKPVPVAALLKKAAGRKAPEGWNVVLAKDEARLIPWLVAPTDSYGFGNVAPPDPAWTTTGKVEEKDAVAAQSPPVLELREAALRKNEFALQLAFGSKQLAITLPEPKGPKP